VEYTNMRLYNTLLSIALMNLALVEAPAATAGELVPFKGRDAGPLYLQSIDLSLGIAVVIHDAEGHSTLLGRHRAQTTTIVDLATGAPLSTSTTFRAANGDTLVTSEEPIGAPDAFTIILRAAITGGTGRFAGARGTYTTISRGDKPLTPDNLPLRLMSVWDGAVSSPGANKRN
jgi:hypothetical protein